MKFLCDAMLSHLGRRLRAAGYDTAIASGRESDRQLVNQALHEGRHFLSSDRHIQQIKGSHEVLIFRRETDEESWARFLQLELQVDWLKAPFTRCLECNEELEEVPSEFRSALPTEIECGHFCPHCKKVYWEGTHVKQMRARLRELNSLR